MNQEKIGKFISECRKEQGLTQSALAEKLGITDRAVSKWETGKSLPDSSIMIELCDLLSISVNDLLKGERIMKEEYSKISDDLVISFKKQTEEQAKMLLRLESILLITITTTFIAVVIVGSYVITFDKIIGSILLLIGTILLFTVAFVGIWIEQKAGYYECAECGHRYKPTYFATLMAIHFGRTRRLRCPECGKISYNKKVISVDRD